MKFTPIAAWGIFPQPPSAPFLVAGPCSAESREQVFETARELQARGAVHLFRAGVWKPRTRPNSFEGLGAEALPWLSEVQTQLNLPCSIEVATAQHVELALKAGIKALWIGARTTVNPFAVQEIADALQGVDIPVLVKNPVNPDIDLWIGAMERLHKAGIHKMAAIHRGFSVYQPRKYRNEPQWEVPIELRRRLPDLTVLSDPSHIAGRRAWLQELAQQALDLRFDGLMMEVHPNPECAWSDAAQQLKPQDFERLLQALKPRKSQSTDPKIQQVMEAGREEIDALDRDLLLILAQRMGCVRSLGSIKNEENLSVLQMERWEAIRHNALAQAQNLDLSPKFVEQLMHLVHNEAIAQQLKLYQSLQDDEAAAQLLKELSR